MNGNRGKFVVTKAQLKKFFNAFAAVENAQLIAGRVRGDEVDIRDVAGVAITQRIQTGPDDELVSLTLSEVAACVSHSLKKKFIEQCGPGSKRYRALKD